VPNVAVGHEFANSGTRNHFAFQRHGLVYYDLESVFPAEFSQEPHISGVLVSDPEILSDNNRPRA